MVVITIIYFHNENVSNWESANLKLKLWEPANRDHFKVYFSHVEIKRKKIGLSPSLLTLLATIRHCQYLYECISRVCHSRQDTFDLKIIAIVALIDINGPIDNKN